MGRRSDLKRRAKARIAECRKQRAGNDSEAAFRPRTDTRLVEGALTMTQDYGRPSNVYERLDSIRMTAAERRDAFMHAIRGIMFAGLAVHRGRFLRLWRGIEVTALRRRGS
jgi:hypothetical protein